MVGQGGCQFVDGEHLPLIIPEAAEVIAQRVGQPGRSVAPQHQPLFLGRKGTLYLVDDLTHHLRIHGVLLRIALKGVGVGRTLVPHLHLQQEWSGIGRIVIDH